LRALQGREGYAAAIDPRGQNAQNPVKTGWQTDIRRQRTAA
jgi:hypothetical protein